MHALPWEAFVEKRSMLKTDIAIVGAGMAGATAAAMLGRAGIRTIVIDPHPVYPPDFRCEKLDNSQFALLRKTGLADAILPVTSPANLVLICRYGRLVERRPTSQICAPYEALVNAARQAIGSTAEFRVGKVQEIGTSADRQELTLSNGEKISARLVVLANGLNQGLRAKLGFRHNEFSPDHSLSFGFDMAALGGQPFPFSSLTYYPEDLSRRLAYLTIFPFGERARANLFAYRHIKEDWVRHVREAPVETLVELFPLLTSMIGEFEVTGPVHARPAHLYVTENKLHDGVVLVGDAGGTSCPAAGTGFNKVLTDVERLCHVHIPNWLSTPGMSAEKIGAFYADPVKVAADDSSLAKAMLTRNNATSTGLRWRARRTIRYAGQVAVGRLRDWQSRLQAPQTATARLGDTQ